MSELFTYDLSGNLTSSTDGNGNTTVFEYDKIGNNVKTTLADGTVTKHSFTKWGTPSKSTTLDEDEPYSDNSIYSDDRGLLTSNYRHSVK